MSGTCDCPGAPFARGSGAKSHSVPTSNQPPTSGADVMSASPRADTLQAATTMATTRSQTDGTRISIISIRLASLGTDAGSRSASGSSLRLCGARVKYEFDLLAYAEQIDPENGHSQARADR